MRVVLSCPMARPTFEPHVHAPFGGSEVRAAIFARGLAALGCDVRVLVEAHGRLAPRCVSDVTLYYRSLPMPLKRSRDFQQVWRRWVYAPYLAWQRTWRSLQKRLLAPSPCPGFDAALGKLNGDVYASFGVHEHSANVIATARAQGRPSLLFLASDTDLCESYRTDSAERNAYGQRAAVCRFALDYATHIVAQTDRQRAMLRARFGRDSTVIRNPISVSAERPQAMAIPKTYDVLWLGRADRFSKRADLALELAVACPNARFLIVMNPRDRAVFDELAESAPSNVEIRPTLDRERVPSVMASCRMLLNTSDAEGFPNTFLQAAQLGLPIVSLQVDPDGMLMQHQCGYCAEGDWSRLVAEVQRRLRDRNCGSGTTVGPEYVRTYHGADERCVELRQLILGLLANDSSASYRGRNAA